MIGSGVGGGFRYLCAVWCRGFVVSDFLFVSTLTVNTIGSFLMGLLLAWSTNNGHSIDHPLRLMLIIGVCGGFTTFSTFSAECLVLIQRGELILAGGYILLSIGLGLLGVWGGYGIINGQ